MAGRSGWSNAAYVICSGRMRRHVRSWHEAADLGCPPRVGVLMNTVSDEQEAQARIAAFSQALKEYGWEVGRNVRIDTRWSRGDVARLRRDATELVGLNPDIILAGVGPTLSALSPLVGDERT